MKDFIEKIKNNKYTFDIMLGIIIILLALTVTLMIIKGIKNNKISELNNTVLTMEKAEKDRLKNSDEYYEFEHIILAFAQTKYYQAYNYYSKDYFKTDEITEINEKTYYKIYRMDEIKEIFTEKELEKFIKDEKIVIRGEDYYIPTESTAENELYVYEKSGEMAIREIGKDRIEFAVEEVYYNSEDGLYDINDTNSKANKFVLIKENGIWKVEEFTKPN